MRIEEDIKLDYSDVLLRPKRSTLESRKDVNLKRTYRFKYSKNEWSGIPIMAANMDGVGELSIAEKLNDHQMITCLTKQHDVKKIKQNKKIKLGICGEHGGDPNSIKFCHSANISYVSASPHRIPIAIVAAAQAAINQKSASSK